MGGVSVIHGVSGEMFSRHLRGEIPNPSGAVEAIITHLVSKIFRIPTAHAPLPYYEDLKERDTSNPRASAEFISTPHYCSVLKGLSRAPRLRPLPALDDACHDLISVNHIGAIVVPATCLGGIPALVAEFSGIPLIAVRENKTILDVTNEKMCMSNVIEVESYLEAAGVVLALRRGDFARECPSPDRRRTEDRSCGTRRIAGCPRSTIRRLGLAICAGTDCGSRIPRRSEDDPAPLSAAQSRAWILQQMDPENAPFNRPLAVRLRGSLEPNVLARTIDEIVRRHEILRTIFPDAQRRPDAARAAATTSRSRRNECD